MDCDKKVIKCLENIGVVLDEKDICNILLSDLIEDSLMFISFIVEIEEAFQIEVSENMLSIDNLSSVKEFSNSVKKILQLN